jgi:hypothetical protein
MKKTYDDILFDEYGRSIPLTADDFIEYLLDNLQQLRSERDRLEKQLADIRLILNDKDPASEDY